jgi:serine/threonine protein kinase
MTISLFSAPSVEHMNELLPAFDFVAVISSSDDHVVYVATQKSLDRHVAIKVYAPHMTDDEQFRHSFEQTARSMAKLNHINLIGVYNSGIVENMLYLVMEFVRGRSVWRSTQGAPLDLTQTTNLLDKVCDGLSHAHEHAILHGRLSLFDVLLNQKLEVKIGNFGHHKIGVFVEDDPESRYQAPELMVSASDLTAQSDVFSLGVMFYELLTGEPYGPGVASPSELTECTEKIDQVWRKATAHRPSMRYHNVREFQVAMQEAMKEIVSPKVGPQLKPLKSDCTVKLAIAQASAAGRPAIRPAAKVGGKVGRPGMRPVGRHVGPSAGQSMQRPSTNSNTIVFRVIMIAALLYAIHLAWNKYKAIQIQEKSVPLKTFQENNLRPENTNQDAGKVDSIKPNNQFPANDTSSEPTKKKKKPRQQSFELDSSKERPSLDN